MIKLKELRKKLGKSQQSIADSIGIGQRSYAYYETNEREADYETLCNFADYFNVSIDYLLGHEVKTETPIQPHKTVVQALFDELSPFEQGQIVERMKIMLEHRNIDYEKIIATCG